MTFDPTEFQRRVDAYHAKRQDWRSGGATTREQLEVAFDWIGEYAIAHAPVIVAAFRAQQDSPGRVGDSDADAIASLAVPESAPPGRRLKQCFAESDGFARAHKLFHELSARDATTESERVFHSRSATMIEPPPGPGVQAASPGADGGRIKRPDNWEQADELFHKLWTKAALRKNDPGSDYAKDEWMAMESWLHLLYLEDEARE
jgi:hypothetical protein